MTQLIDFFLLDDSLVDNLMSNNLHKCGSVVLMSIEPQIESFLPEFEVLKLT